MNGSTEAVQGTLKCLFTSISVMLRVVQLTFQYRQTGAPLVRYFLHDRFDDLLIVLFVVGFDLVLRVQLEEGNLRRMSVIV